MKMTKIRFNRLKWSFWRIIGKEIFCRLRDLPCRRDHPCGSWWKAPLQVRLYSAQLILPLRVSRLVEASSSSSRFDSPYLAYRNTVKFRTTLFVAKDGDFLFLHSLIHLPQTTFAPFQSSGNFCKPFQQFYRYWLCAWGRNLKLCLLH